jgi:hypothetical protein
VKERATYKVIVAVEKTGYSPEKLWVRSFLGRPGDEEVMAALDRDRIALEGKAEGADRIAITEKFAHLATLVQDNGLPEETGKTQTCTYAGVQVGRIELRRSDSVIEV